MIIRNQICCITLTTFVPSFVGNWGDDQLFCYHNWLLCYCYWSYLVYNIQNQSYIKDFLMNPYSAQRPLKHLWNVECAENVLSLHVAECKSELHHIPIKKDIQRWQRSTMKKHASSHHVLQQCRWHCSSDQKMKVRLSFWTHRYTNPENLVKITAIYSEIIWLLGKPLKEKNISLPGKHAERWGRGGGVLPLTPLNH